MTINNISRRLRNSMTAIAVLAMCVVVAFEKFARAAGASEEEIREAVHRASLARHWSAVIYGNQYDPETYKSEIDAAFK